MARRGRGCLSMLSLALTAAVVALGLAACDSQPTLKVIEIKPTVGPFMGGDPVTISGSGFQSKASAGMKVYFGKAAAKKVIVESDTAIRVEPPAGEKDKTVDVEIIFDDSRSAKLANAYKYIDPIGTPE